MLCSWRSDCVGCEERGRARREGIYALPAARDWSSATKEDASASFAGGVCNCLLYASCSRSGRGGGQPRTISSLNRMSPLTACAQEAGVQRTKRPERVRYGRWWL